MCVCVCVCVCVWRRLARNTDDQVGRTKVYEAIVRGEDNFEAGIPESFNVLVKELQALNLDVDLSFEKY